MTKYSPILKAEIVQKYLDGQSSVELSRHYNIPASQIRKWVQGFKLSGVSAFKPRRTKRSFTAEFKLAVIDYYHTHEMSMIEVAAKFGVNACQISTWRKTFGQEGLAGLQHRRQKMGAKSTKKQLRHLQDQSELERLREEVSQLKKENHDLKLERDVTKKSIALFGRLKPVKKRK
ncbi:helix-turn-helix domain-containing protein [[Lactobacillus] timonensis]|uniref:helix-turn-helix domain-containing protein n=1 Tax=[Lactobacillus] timonensis TaxID=1970790 RepID=UPI000C8438A4|nr:helix-turn-helix domain-containing protein [[Lactobacillus] timonensis]